MTNPKGRHTPLAQKPPHPPHPPQHSASFRGNLRFSENPRVHSNLHSNLHSGLHSNLHGGPDPERFKGPRPGRYRGPEPSRYNGPSLPSADPAYGDSDYQPGARWGEDRVDEWGEQQAERRRQRIEERMEAWKDAGGPEDLHAWANSLRRKYGLPTDEDEDAPSVGPSVTPSAEEVSELPDA